MRKLLLMTGAFMGVICATRPVLAQTITFDALTSPAAFNVADGYTEAGFVFRCFVTTGCINNPFATHGSTSFRYAGSAGMFARILGSGTQLTRLDGNAFDIFRIALAANDGVEAPVVTFVGTRADGSTVTQTFNVPSGPPAFSSYAFSGDFTNLQRLEWVQAGTNASHQFDNLELGVATVTPEPASIFLLATGLAGLGMSARRRLRKK